MVAIPVKIIAIGDELLEGRTIDSNSQQVQRALGGHGVQVSLIQVVPDTDDDVSAALERTAPGDLVFISGGLGSTPDDMTRDVVARWGGVALQDDPVVRQQLEARWRKRGLKTGVGVEKQCHVPAGMTALANPVGSAPGLVGILRGRHIVMLPGVPHELVGLLPSAVSWLAAAGILPPEKPHRVWRTAQISELALVKRCESIGQKFPQLRWSWWLTDWGVDVRLGCESGSDEQALVEAQSEVDAALGYLVYARNEATLPAVVQKQMLAAGQTLGVAESCTAGLLGGALTDGSGSSGFFRGGFLTYADEVKHEQLNVPREILRVHGAVSEETVSLMATGCREKLGTDYALAVSGISGPGGGTADKPVGTTWIAVATADQVFAGRYRFPADRYRNRLLTIAAATDTLRRILEFGDGQRPWFADDTWCRT